MSTNRTFVEIIAPDVEQAIAQGLSELGVTRDEVEIEILDQGAAAENRQARVRVALQTGEAEPEDEEAAVSRRVLQELLAKMHIRARVTARWVEADDDADERALLLDVHGDDLAMLIGRKGETLAALQYIVRLIVNKQLNRIVNIVIDIEGYKRRREQQLRRLAARMAEQASQRQQTLTLEPMPANERRIIHLALRDHAEVTTESVGEGEGRQVTIIPKKK